MHIMNAKLVHSLGHGGKIMTSILNHEGLGLSYTELRRYQHDLASFTAQQNQDHVTLPSPFEPGQFTSGAIDNWDHEEQMFPHMTHLWCFTKTNLQHY